jgi:hypothetical protein
MANFLGIVHEIAHDAGIVGEAAAPILSIYNPGLGAIVKGVSDKIVQVEAQLPGDNNGDIKQNLVANDFLSGLPIFQQLLASQGKSVQYDLGKLKQAISDQTKAFNSFAEFQKTFKIVDVAPAAAKG